MKFTVKGKKFYIPPHNSSTIWIYDDQLTHYRLANDEEHRLALTHHPHQRPRRYYRFPRKAVTVKVHEADRQSVLDHARALNEARRQSIAEDKL